MISFYDMPPFVRRFFESDFESFFYPSFFLSLLILLLSIFYSRQKKTASLEDLNYGLSPGGLKVRQKKPFIEISGVKPSLLELSFWRGQFEILENIFGRKFIDVQIFKKGSQIKVRIFADQLPASIDYEECPHIPLMNTWIGKNQFNKDVLINLQENSSVYLDGRPGSGKTVALKALIEGFLRGIGERVRVVIVSTKPSDFYSLQDKENVDLCLIDPFEGQITDQVQRIISEFEEIKRSEEGFKETVEKKPNIGTENMNLERLRRLGISEDTTRKIFIFDEAKDYLSREKADSKDLATSKAELINVVYTHIRRTSRFLSMPIVVASQTQSESDLGIPLKSFSLRLASSTNEAMSKIIAGDKRLTDLSFKQGKFFLKTDKEEHILKVPLI